MFFTRLEELCKAKSKSTTAVCAEIGIAKTTVSYWRNKADVIPKQDVLKKIANYFDVSVDYLIGKTDKQKSDSTEVTMGDIKFALWGGDASIVDDEMLEDVKDFARMLAEKKKRKMNSDNAK